MRNKYTNFHEIFTGNKAFPSRGVSEKEREKEKFNEYLRGREREIAGLTPNSVSEFQHRDNEALARVLSISLSNLQFLAVSICNVARRLTKFQRFARETNHCWLLCRGSSIPHSNLFRIFVDEGKSCKWLASILSGDRACKRKLMSCFGA